MLSKVAARLARLLKYRLQGLASLLLRLGKPVDSAPSNDEHEKSLEQASAAPANVAQEAALADWFARVRKGAPQLLRQETAGGAPTLRASAPPVRMPPQQHSTSTSANLVRSPGRVETNESVYIARPSQSGDITPPDPQRTTSRADHSVEEAGLKEPGPVPPRDHQAAERLEEAPPVGRQPADRVSAIIDRRIKESARQADTNQSPDKIAGQPSDEPREYPLNNSSRDEEDHLTIPQQVERQSEGRVEPITWPSLEPEDSEETSSVSASRSSVFLGAMEWHHFKVPVANDGVSHQVELKDIGTSRVRELQPDLEFLQEHRPWPDLPEEASPNFRHTIAAVLRDQRHRRAVDVEQRGTWNE
jgi:hypothetical protein